MALSAQSVHSSNPANTQLKPHNKIDIHGVCRGSCSNCTECPQFISIPGHVLCAYCGCPPARHGKDPPGSIIVNTSTSPLNSAHDRKRGRKHKDVSKDSLALRLSDTETSDTEQSDSDETSSGVSSFASRSHSRRLRTWRPGWQVTLPPPRVSRLLSEEPVDMELQLSHTWNGEDSSSNIFVKPDDPLTFHRNPVYQTTDAIRGKGESSEETEGGYTGFTTGLHVWAVTWPQQSRGTHPVVGVATKECPLTEPGYKRLVGSNVSSWGWCLKTMKIYHDSRKFRCGVSYPRDVSEQLAVPDTFYMLLDMDRGTLSFQVDDDFLGVAFSGLRGEQLFPIVSAVWGHCEVTLTYINSHHFTRERSV